MGRMCVWTAGVVQSRKRCRLDGGRPSSTLCPPMARPPTSTSVSTPPPNTPPLTSAASNRNQSRRGRSRAGGWGGIRRNLHAAAHEDRCCWNCRIGEWEEQRRGGRMVVWWWLYSPARGRGGEAAGYETGYGLLCSHTVSLSWPCLSDSKANASSPRGLIPPPHVNQRNRGVGAASRLCGVAGAHRPGSSPDPIHHVCPVQSPNSTHIISILNSGKRYRKTHALTQILENILLRMLRRSRGWDPITRRDEPAKPDRDFIQLNIAFQL